MIADQVLSFRPTNSRVSTDIDGVNECYNACEKAFVGTGDGADVSISDRAESILKGESTNGNSGQNGNENGNEDSDSEGSNGDKNGDGTPDNKDGRSGITESEASAASTLVYGFASFLTVIMLQ